MHDLEQRTSYQSQRQAPCLPLFHRDASVCIRGGSIAIEYKQLMRTDWEHFGLLENGLTLSPYNFITILIATGVCTLVAFLYYRFCYDSFKKLLHCQKLARMVLENK